VGVDRDFLSGLRGKPEWGRGKPKQGGQRGSQEKNLRERHRGGGIFPHKVTYREFGEKAKWWGKGAGN